MLKEDISKEAQKRLGLTDEEFTSFLDAVKDGEESAISLPEMHVFTPDEFTQFKENTKKTKAPAWMEEGIKKWKEEKGFDISGKSLDAIYEHAKNEGIKEGGKKPDERFNEIKGKYDLLLTENDTLKKQIEQKDNEMFINSTKVQLTSQVGFETAIKPEQIFVLYAQEFEPVKEEGNLRVKKKGAQESLKDERYNPIDAGKHFLQFAENFKVNGSLRKPDKKDYDPEKPIFSNRSDYNKWVEDSKPDAKTKGQVWLDSLKEHPELAEQI